jgi:Sulfotransferase domain
MSATAEVPAPRIRGPGRRFRRVRLALSLPSKALYAFKLRSTKPLCLPEFLIIGAPKAGTTWLAENLDAHPQVFLARRPGCLDPTEVRYFNQSLSLPLTYYSSLFLAGKDKIKGDKTPGYCTLSAARIRFIRSIMPSVRIIFFMRDPVERAWSHAVMNLVKLKGRRIEDVPPSLFFKHFVRDGDRLRYSRILERWWRVFPEKQVHIGFYEEIAGDPIGVLRGACEHIGADTDVDWSRFPYSRVVNKGQRPPMPEEYRSFLEEMYRDELVQLEGRLGGAVSRWRAAATADRRAAITALSLLFSLSDGLAELAARVF